LRRDFKRTQPRSVILDLRNDDDFIGGGGIDHRVEPLAYRLERADR